MVSSEAMQDECDIHCKSVRFRELELDVPYQLQNIDTILIHR